MSAFSPSSPAMPGASSQGGADLDRFFVLSLDLLCIAGLDGFFKRVNPSWTRVLGWSETELLSRPVAEFMHPDDRERTLQARLRLAEGVPVMGLENRYRCKDGSYRWLAWQSSLYSEAGLVIAAARDITERRQSDEERLVLGKLESTGILAGGVAHDFNNLLANLLLNLELLRLVGPVNEAQAAHVRQALETVRTAQGLTRQLVTFAHGVRAPRRVADLKPLLRDTLAATLAGSAVRGECDIDPDLWPAEIEEAQIRQVLANVVLNAREAMPGGGVINVSARNVVLDAEQAGEGAAGEQVCFAVTDRGPGIPPESRGKVFDPYFSTKPRGFQKGMGLGLTICHAILRQHGGQILVDSRPGGGTSVFCYLPAARDAEPAPVAPANGSAPARTGPRVLVMDDEPWLLDVMDQALAQMGYSPELTQDGAEAVERARAARREGRPFAVALLDLSVRDGMGGLAALGALRDADPDLPAVLMSGDDGGSAFLNHVKLGFQATLSKPFTVDTLRATLGAVLDRG